MSGRDVPPLVTARITGEDVRRHLDCYHYPPPDPNQDDDFVHKNDRLKGTLINYICKIIFMLFPVHRSVAFIQHQAGYQKSQRGGKGGGEVCGDTDDAGGD